MVTGTLTIGRSEPEPDLAVLTQPTPLRTHPSSSPLVIEVAVTALDRDLRTKPTIYAGAVDEYWVVDLDHAQVVVHRDGARGPYRKVVNVHRGQAVTASSVALPPLDTDALFAAALGESA